jgi:DNA-binding NtrC family response regulator
MALLKKQSWSGNVRELRNVVEAALAMGKVEVEAPHGTADTPTQDGGKIRPYRDVRAEVLYQFERRYLSDLMEQCQDNASEAARRAHMDRPYLLSLLRRHGLRN